MIILGSFGYSRAVLQFRSTNFSGKPEENFAAAGYFFSKKFICILIRHDKMVILDYSLRKGGRWVYKLYASLLSDG